MKVYAINVELHIEDTVVDISFLVSYSIGGGMGGWGEMEMADGQNFIFWVFHGYKMFRFGRFLGSVS